MKCKLGFSQGENGQLLVVTEFLGLNNAHGGLSITEFSDEGLFLYYLVLAELEEPLTTGIISNVLLVLSGRPQQADWVTLDLTDRQLRNLALTLPLGTPSSHPMATMPTDRALREVLMQAPMPVTMLVGPEHEFAFINPAYVRLLGRKAADALLGKPIRAALPELKGQPFFGLLDKVYRTGKTYVGREVSAQLKSEETGDIQDYFFDFVYYPVRDLEGEVSGILCQASDVTERVLDRHVREAREQQLYRQWAELEAIYKGAPVGMALVDAREYRVLRINDTNAEFLGLVPQDLVGRRMHDLFPDFAPLRSIYQRVASGEEIRDVQLDLITGNTDILVRRLLVNFSPVLDARGRIEAIASITLDNTETIKPKSRIALRVDSMWTEEKALSTAQGTASPIRSAFNLIGS